MRRSARVAAVFFAMLAVSSCTSSDGMAPPAEVGSGDAAPISPDASAPTTTSVTTASPALAPADAPPMETAAASPAAGEPAPAFAGPQPSPNAAAAMPAASGPAAAVLASSPIQFAPITGTTREAVAPLSERLLVRARERGIRLAGTGMQPAYVLKGYFSEVSDGSATTVLYVWDVTDLAGNRLHRIQGQAEAGGPGGWSAVSARTMQGIADRTIDELALWLSARTG